MVSFVEAFTSGIRTSLCSWLNETDDNVRGWTKDAFGRSASNPALSGIKSALCDSPLLPGTPIPVPTGGQCDTLYTVTWQERWTVRRCSDDAIAFERDEEVAESGVLRGPLSFTTNFRKEYESCGDGRISTWLVGGFDADGKPYSTGPQRQELNQRWVQSNNTTVNYVRVDGQPDDCGDPPPGETPPTTPDGGWQLPPVDITFDDDTGGQTTVNLPPIIFPPVIAGAGIIYAPIRIDTPDLFIDANVNISLGNGLSVDFGNRTPPGSDTTVDAPPPDQPPQLEAPPPDDDDTERRVIGVIVTVTDIQGTPVTEILQDGGNPNIYAPDLGLVAFSVSGGDVGFGWTSDLRVKSTKAYIPCPAPQGGLSVRGTPRGGVAWELTPVFGGRERAFTEPTA